MKINISIGKTANVFTMLKWFNIMRSGCLRIARDAFFDVRALLIEIRDLINGDNVVATRAFKALGVRTRFCKVALPRFSARFDQLNFIGKQNELILSHKDRSSQKQFLDIYGALIDPNAELNKNVLHKVAVLVLKFMTVVTFSEFEKASKDINGKQLIANDAIKKIYHWREANRSPSEVPGEEYHRPCWDDGTAMNNKEINKLRADEYPDIL